jgi:nicotinate-nucleotide adenylyltransferase
MEPPPEKSTELPFGPLKRFGVMGGSFDPVHIGHLSIAQQIMNGLKLEQVILLPAATPPHKNHEMASAADRLEMCQLATHNMHGLSESYFEIKKGGVSYTVETAKLIRDAYGPDVQIYFVIGSDSLADLPQWFKINELLELIDFAIADRRETPIKEALWQQISTSLGKQAEDKLRTGVVSIQRVDISSTLIRQLLKNGEKIPGYLRRDVEEYIRKKGLYGAPPAPTQGGRIKIV